MSNILGIAMLIFFIFVAFKLGILVETVSNLKEMVPTVPVR